PAVFVMLNPSTADADEDDPTIRRCIGFARGWHCGGIQVINLFAYRATNPDELLKVDDPAGPDNLQHIFSTVQDHQFVVCAWGTRGVLVGQDEKVKRCMERARDGIHLMSLGLTKDGHPKHPLYLSKDTPLVAVPRAVDIQVRIGLEREDLGIGRG
ncbi:MAG: DUF1643 domain-containing protein, partial [Thermoplasmata archaeon]|nr:DUF1643 domain-containing protein [Thermoplasmata archaeon]